MAEEVWKDIPHYEGRYLISNQGRVFSLLTKKYLSVQQKDDGYLSIRLYNANGKRKTETIHRLVALAFIENPNHYPEVNHKNEIKTDNRVENLEWCDHKYNINYGSRIERVSKKLTNYEQFSKEVQQLKDGQVLATYPSIKEAERITGIYNSNIVKVCQGKRKTAGGYQWRYKQED